MKRSVIVGRSYKEKESAAPVFKKLTKTTLDEPTIGTFNFKDTFNLQREKVQWSKPEGGVNFKPETGVTSKPQSSHKPKPEVGAEAFSGTYIDLDEVTVTEKITRGGLRDSEDSNVTLRNASELLKRNKQKLDAVETTSVSSSFIELQQVEATGQRSSFVSIKDYPESLAGTSGDTTFQREENRGPIVSTYAFHQTANATTGLQKPEMTSAAATGRRSPVAVIPDRTLQLTPNSVASTSARTVGGITIDPNNFVGNPLAHTMRREMIRGAEEAMPRSGDVEMHSTGTGNPDPDSKTPEKQRCMPVKCLTFVLVCMMLFAGIMAISITFKNRNDHSPLGSVGPDPVAYDECPPSFVRLGETLNFTCTFDTSHPHRTVIKNISRVELRTPQNERVNNITFSSSSTGSILTLYVQSGPNITCSGQGIYTLYFRQGNQTVHHDNVTISVRAGTVRTSTAQKVNSLLTYFDCPGSERTRFEFQCTLENDCGNYNVDAIGSGSGGEKHFNHKMSCLRTHNATHGSKTVCNTTFTEAEVTNHATLGCRFKDTITQYTQTGYLQLPTCERFANCSQSNSLWYFNCTKGSDHLASIHNGKCDYYRIGQCFQPHRPIFKYEKVSFHDGKNDCDRKDLTVPVCRLGWCKQHNYIVKDESPGALLCSSTFDENEANINTQTIAPSTTSPTSTSKPETTAPPLTTSTFKPETTAPPSTTSTPKPETTAPPQTTSTPKPETTQSQSTTSKV